MSLEVNDLWQQSGGLSNSFNSGSAESDRIRKRSDDENRRRKAAKDFEKQWMEVDGRYLGIEYPYEFTDPVDRWRQVCWEVFCKPYEDYKEECNKRGKTPMSEGLFWAFVYDLKMDPATLISIIWVLGIKDKGGRPYIMAYQAEGQAPVFLLGFIVQHQKKYPEPMPTDLQFDNPSYPNGVLVDGRCWMESWGPLLDGIYMGHSNDAGARWEWVGDFEVYNDTGFDLCVTFVGGAGPPGNRNTITASFFIPANGDARGVSIIGLDSNNCGPTGFFKGFNFPGQMKVVVSYGLNGVYSSNSIWDIESGAYEGSYDYYEYLPYFAPFFFIDLLYKYPYHEITKCNRRSP